MKIVDKIRAELESRLERMKTVLLETDEELDKASK